MKLKQKRAEFKRAVLDVFLCWYKTEETKRIELTRACIIAGLDPDNEEHRKKLYVDIISCRRGQYQWEMPLIDQLVKRYFPSVFDIVINTFTDLFA